MNTNIIFSYKSYFNHFKINNRSSVRWSQRNDTVWKFSSIGTIQLHRFFVLNKADLWKFLLVFELVCKYVIYSSFSQKNYKILRILPTFLLHWLSLSNLFRKQCSFRQYFDLLNLIFLLIYMMHFPWYLKVEYLSYLGHEYIF